MFYEPKHGAPLPHDPLNAIIVPRPIGWVSTLNVTGTSNLAPYSFFNAVAYRPPQVMFSATTNHSYGGLKDAVADAQSTGEFVINVATWELREQMNASSVPAPHDVDEFSYCGLTKEDSTLVNCPRVAESPIHLECRYVQSLRVLSDDVTDPNTVVFGEVVGVHIKDELLTDGKIDFLKMRAIGRLGYLEYIEVNNTFSMARPNWDEGNQR